MKDNFGRDIHYLRISVTDLCNLRCVYCMPEGGIEKKDHREILSIEELEEIVRASAECGITKVRITGGEPLVRRGITEICRKIADVPGINEVCMTTNAILLAKYADELGAAGVSRLNISLDSLNRETYSEITRNGSLDDALAGIEAALKTGFDAIKINAVLMGGVNDGDIRELIDLTKRRGVSVRFIELMPIGECERWSRERFISNSIVLKTVPELIETGVDGVAKLYRLPDGHGTVGLISPISSHFCQTCNRIRVTSDGLLKPCLHSETEINLRGLHGEELKNTIAEAILGKPQMHLLGAEQKSRSARNMNAIGG